MAVCGIGDGAGVSCHPLVDGDREGRPGVAVGRARGRVIKVPALRRCAIRECAVGPIIPDRLIVQVVNDAGHAATDLCEDHGTVGGRGAEIRVQIGAAGFAGFVIEPDQSELSRVDGCSCGERPSNEVCVIVAEVKTGQIKRRDA